MEGGVRTLSRIIITRAYTTGHLLNFHGGADGGFVFCLAKILQAKNLYLTPTATAARIPHGIRPIEN
jgi:hypothetical protein